MSQATHDAPIREKDLDDIVEIASRLQEEDADNLSLSEIEAVARELGISPDYVSRALGVLKQRRGQEQEQKAVWATRMKLALVGLVAVTVLAGMLAASVVGAGFIGHNQLTTAYNTAMQNRAQVVNVLERQEVAEARYGHLEPTPDTISALEGAENRVRIERRRYDEAAAAYNARADAFPGSLWVSVFDMPVHFPLSTEIESW